MRRSWCLLLLFIPGISRADWLIQAENQLFQSCLLNSREVLIDEVKSNKSNSLATQALKKLNHFVYEASEDPDLNTIQKIYFHGFMAWRDGEWDSARNAWFEYLELRRCEVDFLIDSQ